MRLGRTTSPTILTHFLVAREKELFYDPRTKTYVFDRDPEMFRNILNYYRYFFICIIFSSVYKEIVRLKYNVYRTYVI